MIVFTLLLACSDTEKQDGTTNGAWTTYSHPCVGNRTDALWMDDANNAFVGCGSTTSGEGFYQTADGGSTWSNFTVGNGFFDSMRVNSISRGADGNLYVAGTGSNNARVVYLDSSNNLQEFYLKPDSGAQSWQTFQVGTFRMDSSGRAVSESFTGSDVMYWPDGGTEYIDGYGW